MPLARPEAVRPNICGICKHAKFLTSSKHKVLSPSKASKTLRKEQNVPVATKLTLIDAAAGLANTAGTSVACIVQSEQKKALRISLLSPRIDQKPTKNGSSNSNG